MSSSEIINGQVSIAFGMAAYEKNEPAYQVASVTLTGDEVTIRMMNTSVVEHNLSGPALRAAFLKNSNNVYLYLRVLRGKIKPLP